MSNVVNGAGWAQWSSSAPNTDHVFYGEYKNTGPGASGTRVRPSVLSLPAAPLVVLTCAAGFLRDPALGAHHARGTAGERLHQLGGHVVPLVGSRRGDTGGRGRGKGARRVGDCNYCATHRLICISQIYFPNVVSRLRDTRVRRSAIARSSSPHYVHTYKVIGIVRISRHLSHHGGGRRAAGQPIAPGSRRC